MTHEQSSKHSQIAPTKIFLMNQSDKELKLCTINLPEAGELRERLVSVKIKKLNECKCHSLLGNNMPSASDQNYKNVKIEW
jgi:hypothetical protein